MFVAVARPVWYQIFSFSFIDILTGNDDKSLILAQSSTADSAVYPRIIDHEITSQGSGSYMSFQNSERFRFPVGFSIFMWIGSITTSAFAAYLTIDYTFRYVLKQL